MYMSCKDPMHYVALAKIETRRFRLRVWIRKSTQHKLVAGLRGIV